VKIGPQTRVGTLLEQYPFLQEILADYSPEFRRLRNPLLRRTFGRVTSLAAAARLGKVEVKPLLQTIAAAIRERTGKEVILASDATAGDDRMETLKQIIRELHEGGDFPELTARFAAVLRDVSPTEIAEMEQQLVEEGLPVTEVKRLCDLHAAVFRRSLEEQEEQHLPSDHPVSTLREENRALAEVIAGLRKLLEALGDRPTPEKLGALRPALEQGIDRLAAVERHYLRKEYQLFPILERHGAEAPPQVMWAVHDDVRKLLKKVREHLERGDPTSLMSDAVLLLTTVEDMFFKEEKILFPMCLDFFTAEDWAAVKSGEAEFGHPPAAAPTFAPGLSLPTGVLTPEQFKLILATLPLDITFVDENDEVRYYSEGDRIFPRSPVIIGRKVQNCHPPASVHVVQKILDAFRSGDKALAEFWIERRGRLVHIRYFALRDADGRYRGVLEVTQDVTAIRRLEGERRLLDW